MDNLVKTIISAPDTTTQVSAAIDAARLYNVTLHFIFGDATATGTVALQVSNDPPPQGQNAPYLHFVPTNWINYATPTSVTAGAATLVSAPNLCSRWVRAVFTYTSGGSTTVTCNLNAVSL